jgi:hypothetical protein
LSDAVYQELVVRMAADPEFANWVRANPQGLTAHFDLTEQEAAALTGLSVEAPAPAMAGAASGGAPVALGTRRSRSSILAVGGLAAAVAVGGGTYAAINALRNQGTSQGQAVQIALGLELVNSSTTAPGGGTGTATASCSNENSPLGGGYHISTSDGAPPPVAVTDSHATDHGWTVSVRNTGSAPLVVEAAAVCGLATASVDSTDTTLGLLGYEQDPGGRARLATDVNATQADCSDPYHLALGGGFSGATGTVLGTFPQSHAWLVTSAAGGPSLAVGANAICSLAQPSDPSSPGGGGLSLEVVDSSSRTVAGQPLTVSVTCPTDTTLVSGGYQMTGDATVVDNYPADDGWKVTVAQKSAPVQFTAYAACLG